MGDFLMNDISRGQNLEMTRLMQSSQRGMKESRQVEVEALKLGVDRMIELKMSIVKDLQSNDGSFEDVVKKSSFPWGRSRYTSLRRGNRNSSNGGSLTYHESSTRLGNVAGGTLRQLR